MESRYDVVIVGSGSAGTAAALKLRKAGRSVLVADRRPFGGTCALRGCDPKKVLVAAAAAADAVERLGSHGIFDGRPTIRWPDLMRFKRSFTEPIPQQRLQTYRDAGIDAIDAPVRFENPHALRVGDRLVEAANVVIAAGAKPMHVVPGDEALIDSEAFLDLVALPDSLIFVGGGYVSFELAHIAARTGCRATILHGDAHPLRGFDPEAVERLVAVSRDVGIDVELQTPATRVERDGTGIAVYAQRDGEERRYAARSGVLGAGRVPDLDDLDLAAGNVERTKRGVKVDRYLRSESNPRVYAAGDAADGGGLPLTAVASYEGELAARNILDGNARSAVFDGLASMVFTIPPLGTVGLTEDAARAAGLDVDVRSGDMTDWYGTRQVAGRVAFYKVVIEKRGGRLLGGTILGPHAQEQINVLALAVAQKLTADTVGNTLFGYPSGASDLADMLL